MGIKENVLTRGKATGGGIRFRKKRMIKATLSTIPFAAVMEVNEPITASLASAYSLAVA